VLHPGAGRAEPLQRALSSEYGERVEQRDTLRAPHFGDVQH